jgi:hypothetical protein
VIPAIWSRSAKGIRRTDAVPDTNGIRTPETGNSYAATFEAMAEYRKGHEVNMSDRKYARWFLWGKVKHLIGLHTFVQLEEWDLDAGSVRFIGMTCWHCQKRV